MKRIFCLALALLTVALSLVSCGHKAPAHEDLDFSEVALDKLTETEEQTNYVIITVENYGKIAVRLYPEVAPETVKNFKKLVSEKFYDGLIFHRVIEDFMIQGGGMDKDYVKKDSAAIKGEFTSNDFENNLKHIKGVISMARTNDKNSASSQFFIMHKEASHLDGEYAAFGYTVAGLDVVDAIAKVATNYNDYPKTDVVITSIRFAQIAG